MFRRPKFVLCVAILSLAATLACSGYAFTREIAAGRNQNSVTVVRGIDIEQGRIYVYEIRRYPDHPTRWARW